MKKMFKSFLATSLSLVIGLSSTVLVQAGQEVKLNIDGYETKAYSQNNRTYLPLEEFSQLLYVHSEFDEATGDIIILSGNEMLSLKLNSTVANYSFLDSEKNSFNLQLAPFEEDGQVYIPLEVAESFLGYDVYWNNEEKTVMMSNDSMVGGSEEYAFNSTVDEELMMEMQKDSTELVLSILESDEFNNFIQSVVELDELQILIQEVVSSEHLNNFMIELLQSENFIKLVDSILGMEEYKLYLEEAMELPSYIAYVGKYGESELDMLLLNGDITTEQFVDLTMEELEKLQDFDLILEEILDPLYLEYTFDLTQLDSYIELQETIMELMQQPEYLQLSEELGNEILMSTNLQLFIEEVSNLEVLVPLAEKIKNMPETEAVLDLYVTGVMEIIQKYELY